MTKHCKKCGKEIGEDDEFCEHCGANLGKAEKKEVKTEKTEGWGPTTKVVVGVIAAIIIGFFVIVFLSSLLSGTTGPICNDPYIVHGEGCCLDADYNGVCDSDEALTVVLDCRLKFSDPFAGGNFPDLITGEITLRTTGVIQNANMYYKLYSRSDSTLKYSNSKNFASIDSSSEKVITFDYYWADLGEIWTGETGFPGGVMWMPIEIEVTCNDCLIKIQDNYGRDLVDSKIGSNTLTYSCVHGG